MAKLNPKQGEMVIVDFQKFRCYTKRFENQ